MILNKESSWRLVCPPGQHSPQSRGRAGGRSATESTPVERGSRPHASSARVLRQLPAQRVSRQRRMLQQHTGRPPRSIPPAPPGATQELLKLKKAAASDSRGTPRSPYPSRSGPHAAATGRLRHGLAPVLCLRSRCPGDLLLDADPRMGPAAATPGQLRCSCSRCRRSKGTGTGTSSGMPYAGGLWKQGEG